MVRTTVNLPDDVYSAAHDLARTEGMSLDDALAALVRQGLKEQVRIDTSKAFPCFTVSPDAEAITPERTLEAEDQL